MSEKPINREPGAAERYAPSGADSSVADNGRPASSVRKRLGPLLGGDHRRSRIYLTCGDPYEKTAGLITFSFKRRVRWAFWISGPEAESYVALASATEAIVPNDAQATPRTATETQPAHTAAIHVASPQAFPATDGGATPIPTNSASLHFARLPSVQPVHENSLQPVLEPSDTDSQDLFQWP